MIVPGVRVVGLFRVICLQSVVCFVRLESVSSFACSIGIPGLSRNKLLNKLSVLLYVDVDFNVLTFDADPVEVFFVGMTVAIASSSSSCSFTWPSR